MAQQRFVATKEHRRFVEFADAVRRQHTIGICYGQAGIGKTLSAKRYANWHKAQTLLEEWGPREDSDFQIYAALARKRTVFFTPGVLTTPKQVQQDLTDLTARVSICIDQHLETLGKLTGPPRMRLKNIELLIVDESERLSPNALAYLRDQHDRTSMSLILIGMPGIEKQFSRYPQLYSRVGFAHEYRPWQKTNCALSEHVDGANSATTSTPTTTPTPKPSPPLLESPTATSASWTDCSPKWNAS